MTRPSDTEAVSLTEQERERLETWERDGLYACPHKRTCPSPVTCREKYGLFAEVASILAARLAGGGAQVTEAAVEAAAEALNGYSWHGHLVVREGTSGTPTALEIFIREDMAPIIARAALSAALPHMGTGQPEADLRARISALADEWEALGRTFAYNSAWYESKLRNLLDRPAAAETKGET